MGNATSSKASVPSSPASSLVIAGCASVLIVASSVMANREQLDRIFLWIDSELGMPITMAKLMIIPADRLPHPDHELLLLKCVNAVQPDRVRVEHPAVHHQILLTIGEFKQTLLSFTNGAMLTVNDPARISREGSFYLSSAGQITRLQVADGVTWGEVKRALAQIGQPRLGIDNCQTFSNYIVRVLRRIE